MAIAIDSKAAAINDKDGSPAEQKTPKPKAEGFKSLRKQK